MGRPHIPQWAEVSSPYVAAHLNHRPGIKRHGILMGRLVLHTERGIQDPETLYCLDMQAQQIELGEELRPVTTRT